LILPSISGWSDPPEEVTPMTTKRQSAFLLRLPASLKQEALDFAKDDGTSLNHFISLAVAEKIARIQAVPGAATSAVIPPIKRIS
jgi:hypothetical protein